mgnify:CR=1 FL=1
MLLLPRVTELRWIERSQTSFLQVSVLTVLDVVGCMQIIHEDPIGTDPPTQRSCFADDHEHEPDPADAVIVPMSRNVRIGLYAAVVVLLILTIVFWASVDSLLRELRTAITSLGDFWGAFAIAYVFLVHNALSLT